MHLIEVTSADTAKDFLEVQAIINAGNPNYIRPLNNEVNDVFNPLKNKNFKYGEAKRWILETDDGELVGRIAAFTNTKYINKGGKTDKDSLRPFVIDYIHTMNYKTNK
jgi:hypothetical protein